MTLAPRPWFRRASARALSVAVAIPLLIAAVGCGTDAVGVQACRNIETARCNHAAACGVSLDQPLHSGSDATSCIRFYNDACLHGLASNNDPGAPKVQACVDAINSGDCATVKAPETNVACAFLIPPAPAPVVDAASDATDGADAATDAASDAVAE
jgi:hypothetical protein